MKRKYLALLTSALLMVFLCNFCNSKLNAQVKTVWKFATDSAIYSSPVSSAGLVYFGSGDQHLYALHKSSGKMKWKFKTNGAVHSSPVIHEQQLIFSSADGQVYSLDKDKGDLIWKFKTKGEQKSDIWDYYLSAPTVDDQLVYIGSGDSTIYALELASGKMKWAYKTGGIVHATPVVKDNMVLLGSYDGFFYALDAKTGVLNWKFKTIGDQYFPKGEIQKAAMVQGNTVYFGSRDFNIYALDLKTGTGKWNMKEIGSWVIASPVFHKDCIYFGTSDTHRFYAMNAGSGTIKWTLPLNMRVYGSAILTNNELVFGCFNGKIYFVDPETGKVNADFQTEESRNRYDRIFDHKDQLRKDLDPDGSKYKEVEKKILSLGSILSTPLAADGMLYFGDSNGFFYALQR
ncbi:outer membrane protein assembly factor BamB family protein [Pedobacter caeni]|uniref:Outer membrane protein assembly factor BamB, contains PQQ-like beta-propeller repeat n=1 Tax=Pedobacter caeni TaxID=288992 RepID=A0A1M5ABV4_9SPHI|nr:PQQ-binding-like beta-propeller repeat protein [Pedobacter caeni]SHF27577.1 Outer membrane protein assembly factor BamB, contains PQQ-like beta-propeller repeat [Pedobacter caeni]